VLPLAIPESDVPQGDEPHPLHLQIWADNDKSGTYDDPSTDHVWPSVDLPASGNLVFVHSSDWDPITEPEGLGGDLVIHFDEMDIHEGHRLEVMVIESESGRAVGMYRIPQLTEAAFDVVIPDVIEPGGVSYRIEWYADANDNETYDDFPDDHTWVQTRESNDKGIEFTFGHDFEFQSLDYQFDFEE